MGTAVAFYIQGQFIDRMDEVFAMIGETPEALSRPASDPDDADAFYEEGPSNPNLIRRIVAQRQGWTTVTGDISDLYEHMDAFAAMSKDFDTRVLFALSQTNSGAEVVWVWDSGKLTREFYQADGELRKAGTPLPEEEEIELYEDSWGPWEAMELAERLSGFGLHDREASRFWAYENSSPSELHAETEQIVDKLSKPKKPWWRFW